VRKHGLMKRYVTIIVAAAVLGVIALLVVLASPPAENADAGGDARATSSGNASTQGATSPSARAAATAPTVSLQKLPQSFDQPLYVTSPPGDTSRLFVVEKTGVIRIIKNGVLLPAPFLDIHTRVSAGTEQGLLSLAFDPRFATNRRFYIDYTNTAGNTRVVRYVASAADPDVAAPSSAKVILRVAQPYSNHNGGQLAFSPGGRLFVGMGDGGSAGDPQGRAQNSRSRLGKLLRINVNASPMTIGVYAKGLRNPWRFSFDRATGNLWIGDVGQNRWEEVDFLRAGRAAGANLGWNGYEGTHVYNAATAARLNRSKLTWPVGQYSHSFGEAVTGGYVYRGSAIPALRGWYLFADFASGHVWAKKGRGGAKQLLPGADGKVSQIASFGQDAAGELYIVSLAGSIYKITP
jgi:glucose/arabinose dehydrogenase